jgi:hypothetical protein
VSGQKRVFVKCGAVIAALLIVVGAAWAAELPPAKPLVVPVLPYQKYTLPNGLEVILYENHKLPLVAVDLWYHVGPMNEMAGRTGFAHLFEHMMFEGSEHRTSTGQRTMTARTISKRCPAISWSWHCGWRATGWGSCWRPWTGRS